MTAPTSEPFQLTIADDEIADLRARLRATRWPDPETVGDWSQGTPTAYARDLAAYWVDEYDMQRLAARLNAHPQFRTVVDGVAIHHLHLRSDAPDAPAVILTHGWPGSVVEFLDVLEPLNEHFHLIVPSLPGYGWTDRPTIPGTGVGRIGELWDGLARALGYDKYFVQGGDWGAIIATTMGIQAPAGLRGIHINLAIANPAGIADLPDPTAEEQEQATKVPTYLQEKSGYSTQQSTKPQTTAYGLADSPVGQLTWIIEKFAGWTDHDGDHEAVVPRDVLLDNVMVYWLTNTAASSARLYWESFGAALQSFDQVTVPTAYSAYPEDLFVFSERWARTRYPDLRYYSTPARGGHFAALERGAEFAAEVIAGIGALRS